MSRSLMPPNGKRGGASSVETCKSVKDSDNVISSSLRLASGENSSFVIVKFSFGRALND